jgi:DNA-directed RNA polymerase subunit M/transcription elongation factor TFIIS
MKAYFVLTLVIILAICFTTNLTPTVAEDTTDRTIERYLYNAPHSTDNNNSNNNDKDDQKKKGDINHSCLKCNSHSLSFEGRLDIYEGKRSQLIHCNGCGFEWQDTWTLSNWSWLKSS